MTSGNLQAESVTVNKDCAAKDYRWCGEPGGVQRGQGKSRDFWFHVNCFRAVHCFFGWELELRAPTQR